MSASFVEFGNLEQRMHKSKLAGFIIDWRRAFSWFARGGSWKRPPASVSV
jgi:hypothetical protein